VNNRYPLFGRNSKGTSQPVGTPKLDNFGNPKSSLFAPVTPISPEMAEEIKNTYEFPIPVILPRQSHAPEGARTVDLRRLVTVANGGTSQVVNMSCLPSATLVFLKYALVLPSGGFPNVTWSPTVDGKRVLQYHGDQGVSGGAQPMTTLNISTGNDFSAVSLVDCQLLLQPGQNMSWNVTNNSGAPIQMGVRLVGYLDLSQQLLSSKFGD
jgi:hypothetical protein